MENERDRIERLEAELAFVSAQIEDLTVIADILDSMGHKCMELSVSLKAWLKHVREK